MKNDVMITIFKHRISLTTKI